MKNSGGEKKRILMFAEALSGILLLVLSQILTECGNSAGQFSDQLKVSALLAAAAGILIFIHVFFANRRSGD